MAQSWEGENPLKQEESLIGKQYIPIDTSWLLNLTTPGLDVRLAGTTVPISEPKVCKVVSEPYEFIIKSRFSNKTIKEWFVNVEYNGMVFRVLYNKISLNLTLKKANIKIFNRSLII